MQQLFGHREILARQAVKLSPALDVVLKLRGCGARLRANSRTAGQKQRQQRHAVEVCGLGEVTVPHGVGVARQLSPPEIHQEKRQIVQDVRAGNLVVELDPVEQRRTPVQQNDVAQVEVTVTLTHEAGLRGVVRASPRADPARGRNRPSRGTMPTAPGTLARTPRTRRRSPR